MKQRAIHIQTLENRRETGWKEGFQWEKEEGCVMREMKVESIHCIHISKFGKIKIFKKTILLCFDVYLHYKCYGKHTSLARKVWIVISKNST